MNGLVDLDQMGNFEQEILPVWQKVFRSCLPESHCWTYRTPRGEIIHYFRSPVPGATLEELKAITRIDQFGWRKSMILGERFRLLIEMERDDIERGLVLVRGKRAYDSLL